MTTQSPLGTQPHISPQPSQPPAFGFARPSVAQPASPATVADLLPKGDRNANPAGVGFIDLLREDFATYERNPMDPGFWAVAVHRFGNWRMGLRPKLVRAPFSLLYRTMYTSVNWMWGIDIGYNIQLGRRVRLWHHGGMVLSARAIGNDVHIRHNTTFGVARRDENWKKPIIGDRVDVGVGACILGDVTVGHDSVIGANAVVTKSCAPFSTMVGVPARPLERGAHHLADPEMSVAFGVKSLRGSGA